MQKINLPRANEQIKAKEVRLVDENGEMLGVFSIRDALDRAASADLDLIEISPNAVPPLCKIFDLAKYKYEQKKKLSEIKKKQKTTQIKTKELKFRPNIGQHDFEIKVRNIEKFIESKCKVKIILLFKGREIVHQELGMNILNKIVKRWNNNTKIINKILFVSKM